MNTLQPIKLNSRIIVTGASGMLGSHLLMHLIKNKQNVIALKRENSNIKLVKNILLWYGISDVDIDNFIEWKDVDLIDIESLDELITDQSIVYHCAAQVSFEYKDRDCLMITNAQGTSNVVNACLKNNAIKLCYVSSVSTLSVNKGETTIHENSFWKNTGKETVYAQSKYLAEMEVWRGIEEGLNAVIVNPSVIIGPHDFSKGSAKMIETAANGLTFYTSGVTGFVDVNDVVKVMILLMNENISSERFLLNSENLSYQSFFNIASSYLNKKAPTIKVKPWLSGIAWRIAKLQSILTNRKPFITKETANAAMNKKYYDSSKVINLLSYKFNSIDETIKNACEFYIKHQKK